MKNKVIEVKQKANLFARSLNNDKDFTTHPSSFRRYSPRKNTNGEWVTGLTVEEAIEYGNKIKKDLSPNSDYWETIDILLVDGMKSITFNMNNIEQAIRYKCAIGNKFLAETKEQLNDPEYKVNDSFLYVYDPIGDVERENVLQEIKDETTSLIHAMKSQKEKMMCICAKLNIPFNDTYTAPLFYQMLSRHKSNLKKMEHLEKLRDVLQTPQDILHIEYEVNKNMGKAITMINTQWTFANKVIGNTKAKVLEFFLKNEDMFFLLIDESEKEKK